MSINQHSEYEQKKPLIKQVRDTIKGQAHMRNQRELYIKKTSGMVARGDAGALQYDHGQPSHKMLRMYALNKPIG